MKRKKPESENLIAGKRPPTRQKLIHWLTREGGGWHPIETLGEKPTQKVDLVRFAKNL